MEPTKTIVLDRDGVVNKDSVNYIRSHEDWDPLPGSLEAISLLHNAGYRILIATNQSGLGRGYFDEIALANIHQKLCYMVEDAGGLISGIFYCPHLPVDDCECRKPKTGLLSQAEQEFDVTLAGDVFVGDSLKDMEAAFSFSMSPVLVRTGNGKATESKLAGSGLANIPVYDDLYSAVQGILAKEK